MDDERLIFHVQQYPCLYDRGKSVYHDKLAKTNSWVEISMAVMISVDTCKRRWKSIRDKYRRALEKRETNMRSGAGQQHASQWDLLPLLAPFTAVRSTFSNVEESLCPSPNSTPTHTLTACEALLDDSSTIYLDQSTSRPNQKAPSSSDRDTIMTEPQNDTAKHQLAGKRKVMAESPRDATVSTNSKVYKKARDVGKPSDVDKIIKAIGNISDTTCDTVEEDSDELFLKSLLPDIKTVTNKKKLLFKCKCLS